MELSLIDSDLLDLFRTFAARRRDLRMSLAALAKRSGVSLPTVARILSGRAPHASVANVLAIANSLGMTLGANAVAAASEFRNEQAERKARQIVALVQGTSALEAQAVDDRTIREMTRQTVCELLAGSPRTLWSE